MSQAKETFEVTVPGKWVLAGEHSVLRGGPAVALPISSYSLKLSCVNSSQFEVHPRKLEKLIDLLIQRAIELDLVASGDVLKKFYFESSIPLSAGLGSSAALCVAFTHWISSLKGASIDKFEVARKLEDLFHGKSSGMDIAVVLENAPVKYQIQVGIERLVLPRLPQFSFHDTGIRSPTSICVEKVQGFFSESPQLGKEVDECMGEAVEMGVEGLIAFGNGDEKSGLDLICRSMKGAHQCFERWGLITPEMKPLISDLIEQGALAVKLTGGGLGGFLVALWPSNR